MPKTYDDLLALAESQATVTPTCLDTQPDSLPTQDDTTAVVEHRICDALELDVLGEREDGKVVVVFAAHKTRRKTVGIRDADRLTYARLLQIAGPPVQELVDESGEESYNRFSVSQVRNAICLLGGRNRLQEQALSGLGCWQALDDDGNELPQVIIVGAGEAAVWDGQTLRKITRPRVGSRLLDLSSGNPWYDFATLTSYLRDYTHPWAERTVEETIGLFNQWQWRHQVGAPEALTGLVLASWVQTLWSWRPQVAILGATGTGKTTLFETLGGIFGNLCLRSSDSTAAYLRQSTRDTAMIPLADEFEDSRHRREVLRMIRLASRGDKTGRGTTAQKAIGFELRQIFWVAAIEAGMKKAPDINRFVTIEPVLPIAAKQGQLTTPSIGYLKELGQRLLAIAVYHVIEAKMLAVKLKLSKHPGIGNRAVESYAVPISMLARACELDEKSTLGLMRRMLRMVPEEDRDVSDETELLHRIMRADLRLPRGETLTVAEGLVNGGLDQMEILARNGIGIVLGRPGHRGTEYDEKEYLFLDPDAVTEKLLRGTEWQDQTIRTILKRIEGAEMTRRRLARHRVRGVTIPMEFIWKEVIGKDEDDGTFV